MLCFILLSYIELPKYVKTLNLIEPPNVILAWLTSIPQGPVAASMSSVMRAFKRGR